jgi:hypothetical protein
MKRHKKHSFVRRREDLDRYRQEKEIIARLCWSFDKTEKDRYYYYVTLLLIWTGTALKDLLQITVRQAESVSFQKRYPLIDSFVISRLKRISENKNCSFLLSVRCRKSYIYYFRKLIRKSGMKKCTKRIVPVLKGRRKLQKK